MSWRATAVTTLTVGIVVGAHAVPAGQQPFTARVDVVHVNVSVKRGNNPVPGLIATDFAVFDNGVRQRIDSIGVENVPVDATLFLDTSGSTAGELPSMIAAVHRISQLLRPGDQFRVLTIGQSVYQSVPWSQAGADFDLRPSFVAGVSLIWDAVALAIRHPMPPGRRHVVIALTDGQDCGSLIQPDALIALASRSDAVVHWVEMGLPSRTLGENAMARCFFNPMMADTEALATAAERTGGLKHTSVFHVDPVKDFEQILSDFRQSYVLTFTPSGVDRSGWHALHVDVPSGKYTVHARAGYDGGA